MGTVTRRKGRNKTSYRAQINLMGVREGKTFDSLGLAHMWIEEREKAIRSGEVQEADAQPGDMTLYDAMEKCILESRQLVSKSQIESYKNSELIFRRFFSQHKKMSEVTHNELSAHMIKRMTEDGVGPSSIRNELSFIRRTYQMAVSWGVDLASPEIDIKRPKAKLRNREERLDNIIKPHELEEIFRRAKRARNNLYSYLKFLLYTGMRPSEAASLYWKRLPRTEERAAEKKRLPTGYVDLDRGGFSRIGTKTEKRFVPAHSKIINLVEEMQRSMKKDKKLVFLDDKYIGRHMAYKYYRRSMQTVCSNAKDDHDLREEISFYSFRHTFRSRLEECGVSTAFAETILGHSDRSFKFTYIHLSDDSLINAVQLLDYGIDI